MSFEIVADSCIDLSREIIEKYNIKIASLTCIVEGVLKKCYSKDEKEAINQKELYEKMRKRAEVSTSLAPPEEFEKHFEEAAKAGKDILCITIAATLSGTHQSAKIAAEIVKLKYPDINIYIFDSYIGSLGEGILCLEAAIKREKGEAFLSVVDYLEQEKHKMCGWFTFDELYYLKKGGRVSATSAFVGTMLGIKPVMNINKEAVIVPNAKVRGRRAAIETLLNGIDKCIDKVKNQIVGIIHGDCIEEAEALKEAIKNKYGTEEFLIEYMDPVIGAHGGPGALGVFFKGKKE